MLDSVLNTWFQTLSDYFLPSECETSINAMSGWNSVQIFSYPNMCCKNCTSYKLLFRSHRCGINWLLCSKDSAPAV